MADQDVDYFVRAFNDSLGIYRRSLEQGFEAFLVGEPAKPVFRRKL